MLEEEVRTKSRATKYVQAIQAQIAKVLCQEQAIDCGYAALASAIEGKPWERARYLKLMRRFGFCAAELERFPLRREQSGKGK